MSQRSVGSNITGKWEKVVIRPVLCARHWWLSYLPALEHKTGVLTITVLPEFKFSDLLLTILFTHTILNITISFIPTYLFGDLIQHWAGSPVIYFAPLLLYLLHHELNHFDSIFESLTFLMNCFMPC